MLAYAYRVLLTAFAGLAPDTASRLGAALGTVVFHVGLRRRVVSANLARCLHLAGPQRRRVALRCYQHVAATFVEVWGIHRQAQPARILNPQWLQHLQDSGRGVVFVSLHLGNWDAAGAAIARRTGALTVYARRQRDVVLNTFLGEERQRSHMDVIFAKHDGVAGAVGILRLLRRGGCLGLTADQLPRRKEGCQGYMLHEPTRLHTGPAVLARLSRSWLVPGISLRRRSGEHVVVIGRPIPPGVDDDATTQHCMDVLAAVIAAHPEQYFWQHRRFKRPIDLPPRPVAPWQAGLGSWKKPSTSAARAKMLG